MRGPEPELTRRARSLRPSPTPAQTRLWRKLRNRGLNGYKFVRQESIGAYFADFVCRMPRLVVEVDAATPSTDAETALDAQRTAFLTSVGYRVLRFDNAEIAYNLAGVLETILALLEGRETL